MAEQDTVDAMTYEVVEGWEQLPSELTHDDVVAVSTDSQDRLFILTRRQSQVIIYNDDGSFVNSWGQDLFTPRTHGLTVAPDDTLYVTDDGAHVVYHMDVDGNVLQEFGQKGVPSDSGYDGSDLATIVRGAPPFNRPTNVAIGPTGEVYVSDGYGNARVHRFSPDGRLIQSWGEPGLEASEFHNPHGIAVTAAGEVMVADRENDRIQFFTLEGEYLREWTDVQRPTNIDLDGEGRVYVSELWRMPDVAGQSFRLGPTTTDLPGRVSVYDASGKVLARWGGPDRTAPGNFIAPHDICVNSKGEVYVGEVSYTFAVSRGHVEGPVHSLQKFVRTS